MSKTINVAVSGVGGGVGQSIIKALHGQNIRIISLDGDYLATGLYAETKGFKIPYANRPRFLERILNICKGEKCKFYFPGLDAELPILAKYKDTFKKVGTTVIVSDSEIIEICDDKLITYKFLSRNNILTPVTHTLNNFIKKEVVLDFPMIIKPRKGGARSKNVFLLRTRKDFDRLLLNDFPITEYIIQEYIDGDEYTCGTINFESKHFGTVVMKRILRDGDTYKCFTEKNISIEKEVSKLMKILKPFGPCNVQLRMKKNLPYVIELNARCSGTTAARALAGFNEPKMTIDYLFH